MKLDIELVRQIMLSLEDGTWYNDHCHWIIKNANIKDLSYYRKVNQLDREIIIYNHIKYCIECGLIAKATVIFTLCGEASADIHRAKLTPYGHEFLNSSRKNEVWDKLKSLDFENLSLAEVISFGKKLSIKWIEKKLNI